VRNPHATRVYYPRSEEDRLWREIQDWLNDMIGPQTRNSNEFFYEEPKQRGWFDNGQYANIGMQMRGLSGRSLWFLTDADLVLFTLAFSDYQQEFRDGIYDDIFWSDRGSSSAQ
jgi:hypothetical protein